MKLKSRSDYFQARENVRAMVQHLDPYCLIETGCPEDEFDMEISLILADIRNWSSPEDIAITVSRVFGESLGERNEHTVYLSLSRRLFDSLKKENLV